MSKTKSIEIRCQHCRAWFPSPIFFEDSDSFDTSMLFDNLARCANCGEMTGCDKDNFRAFFEDDGFRGVETT